MTVDTQLHEARDRVRDELDHVAAKQRAYDTYSETVRGLDAVSPGQPPGATTISGGGVTAAKATALCRDRNAKDQCRRVREAFAETVRPHSTADLDRSESLLATIQAELGDEIAVTVAADSDCRFTPSAKTAILSAIANRTAELQAMERALLKEEESLARIQDACQHVVDWLVETDQTPLTNLGFDALRERHERLESHRETCETLLDDRQEILHSRSNQDGDVVLTHQSLLSFLYSGFPDSHPVLATLVRLDDLLEECQRAVRSHLVEEV
jgi:hypothetical protein